MYVGVYEFNPKAGSKIFRKNDRSKKNTGYVQADGSVWSQDVGDNHGESSWKRYRNKRDFEKDRREGTYDIDGKRLR
ncbi:hypothetical protein IW492_11320 [Enterococcus sp. BWB1-3]|uniref:hypothetical protein n=1 Tax=Enterococcus sp. BWB1-3 TaxID=2787713 RepID=UPI001F305690|nr:hypothetical protein [Enterococcus sp. BWB1-3]MBL1229821.1 hypothetical protein [Enterococcus sp. BWB1-3]